MNSYKHTAAKEASQKFFYDCAVIGGGASGMIAAITAARKGAKVVLIEHNKKLGTKLLQTGNGKCNFTNLYMSSQMYQNEDTEFVQNIIDKFNVSDTLKFFKELGVFYNERGGYVYPHSGTAASVQEALIFELGRLNVKVKTDFIVTAIEKKDNRFIIKTEGFFYEASSVIIAAGSKASPKTGSDGSGYNLAANFGHTIIKPLPALVQLVSDMKYCANLSGVRSTGNISLYVDSEFILSDYGEIQYTDYGISGIPVFQISRYAVKALDLHKKVSVTVDMLADIDRKDLYKDIEKRITADKNKNIEQFFAGILNKKLIYGTAKAMGLDLNAPVKDIGVQKLCEFTDNLRKFKFDITGSKGFDTAQVCQGGVNLNEINHNMESKLIKNLFFAGEIADVDGRCGGYNLQWAWSSGYVAGLNSV